VTGFTTRSIRQILIHAFSMPKEPNLFAASEFAVKKAGEIPV
jgi:hypothetical protein